MSDSTESGSASADPGRAHGVEQLEEEQRVARARAARSRRRSCGESGVVVGRQSHDLDRRIASEQRQQREREAAEALVAFRRPTGVPGSECVTSSDLPQLRARTREPQQQVARSPRPCAARPRRRASSACPARIETRNRIVTSASRSRRKRSSRLAVSGVGGRSRPSRMPSSGIHGTSPGSTRSTHLAQPRLDLGRVGVGGEPEHCQHRCAEREVRRRRLVLLAARVEDDDDPAARSISSSTSRDLPSPGSPLTSTIQPSPARTSSKTCEQRLELARRGRAAASRSRRSSCVPAIGPTTKRVDELRLPLRRERLDRRRLEGRARAVEHDLGREDLAGLRLAHDARGGVDRIAEDAVGAAVRRAEVAGEDLAGVDADPHRHDARACP